MDTKFSRWSRSRSFEARGRLPSVGRFARAVPEASLPIESVRKQPSYLTLFKCKIVKGMGRVSKMRISEDGFQVPFFDSSKDIWSGRYVILAAPHPQRYSCKKD